MENIYREYWMQLIFLYVLLLHQNCCDVQNLKKTFGKWRRKLQKMLFF